MVGVALIFFFAWPQPSFERGGARIVEESDSAAHDAEVTAKEKRYRLLSGFGLILIFAGFGFELVAEFAPREIKKIV
jgi:hypothetical protein